MKMVWFLRADRYFIFRHRELLRHFWMLDLSNVFVTIYWLVWSFTTLVKAEHKYCQQALAVEENRDHAFIFWVRC